MTTPSPIRVLFVCMGNICRSPAADIIFTELVKRQHLQSHFEIDSAATHNYHPGSSPDHRMATTLSNRGYSVFGKAKPISKTDLIHFDLILAMDDNNFENIIRLDSSDTYRHKVIPMTRYATHHSDTFVPDPYHGGNEGFEHVVDLLEDCCAELLKQLRAKI